MPRHWYILILLVTLCGTPSLRAVVLWSDLGATLAHETGAGTDILGGAVKRDDTATDTLYFKFHVDPLSDASTEEYFAAFQLYEGNVERLGVGNSLQAWAYSAFNTAGTGESNKVFGDMDLRSAQPELFVRYELPRRGQERTIVFKVHYVPGGEDQVTVWMNPDLAAGATEASQPANLTTHFAANASFDQIRLRHGGGGGGWTFSDMAVATSFNDFVVGSGAETGTAGRDDRAGASPLTFRSWQREQGLPQNAVHALAQTAEGYLWLGVDDGVVRFDGVRFIPFGLREGFRGGPVRVLLADSLGSLWIGTSVGGLTRSRNGQFTTFTMREGLPSDSVAALAEDNTGRIWIGTESGLAIWDGTRLAPPAVDQSSPGLDGKEPQGKAITALFKDAQGAMWLGVSGAGVYRYAGGKFERVEESSVGALLNAPHSLLVDKAGRLWVGAGEDYVLCRDAGNWRRYRIPRHLVRPYVSALAEAKDGTIWAGSVSEGLFRFQQGKLAVVNASSGLSDNLVEALLVDQEGNVWAGTGSGLTRVRRSELRVLGQTEELGYGPVQALAEIAPGIIWAAKPAEGLYRWEGRKFSRVIGADGSRTYPGINTLLTARDGTCWAGSTRGLLHFVTPNAPAPEGDLAALPDENVLALTEARAGGIWAGTQSGKLWRGRNGTWLEQTNFNETHPVVGLAEARDGSLWIGTDGGGLHRFNGGELAHLDRHSGLLSDAVRALYLDSNGVLWIGTAGGGLGRWEEGRLLFFTTHEGLPDNFIFQILEDNQGRLWLGTRRGIASVAKGELEQTPRSGSLAPLAYTRAEGMPSDECAGGFSPAGLRTQSGVLWFPTVKGIVTVDARPAANPSPAPSVVMEEVIIDGTVATATGPAGIRVGPGKHRLQIHYTALNFSAPERTRFRYRLQPLDRDWIEAGAQRVASYDYLPPGEYVFQVSAANAAGAWSPAGATLSLTVRPHLWQNWWFITLAGFGALAGVAGGARILEKRRMDRRLKQVEQERAIERERGRIAQDLHDDLGSSLARISLLSSLARADREHPDQLQTHIDKIAQSADDTVRALEEIVWAVRPGSDSVQSLIEYVTHFASELFEGNGARCRLDLPPDLPERPLPPEMRHNIFLVVKEALTNALKHSSAKEVRVQAKTGADSLEIIVQDDGQGFDPQQPSIPGKQHGLGNMRERAAAMGGTLQLESRPGKGTRVGLRVNLPADNRE